MASKRVKFGSGEFRRQSVSRTMNVLRSAAQKLAHGQRDRIGGVKHGGHSVGAIPVDTGNLMRSLMASTAAMPMATSDGDTGDQIGQVTGTILGWQEGQTLWMGYTMKYAPMMEFGFVRRNGTPQPGYFFVREGVNKWPRYLKEAENELPEF